MIDPSLPFGQPIKVSAGAQYNKGKQIDILDTKVFKREENKIEDVGNINRKKFAFECRGDKPSVWKEAIPFDEKINRMKKLLDEGKISQAIYDKTVEKIMDDGI